MIRTLASWVAMYGYRCQATLVDRSETPIAVPSTPWQTVWLCSSTVPLALRKSNATQPWKPQNQLVVHTREVAYIISAERSIVADVDTNWPAPTSSVRDTFSRFVAPVPVLPPGSAGSSPGLQIGAVGWRSQSIAARAGEAISRASAARMGATSSRPRRE